MALRFHWNWLPETTEEMSQNAKTEKMTSAFSADKSNAGDSIAFLRMYIYPLESLPQLEKGPRAKESRVGGLAVGLLTITVHDGYTGSVFRHPSRPGAPLELQFDGTAYAVPYTIIPVKKYGRIRCPNRIYGCPEVQQMG
ncbi:hypothetical protein B0H14DRAFT_2567355 [Mycena olivaceomarginata]|nr:hypothetical protein B0H14DRAFT_2567355 [Mycena olivaceomarginata]